MAHDPNKDDPLWADFYRSHPQGPTPTPAPPKPKLSYEQRLDLVLRWTGAVSLAVAGYAGLVVLAILLASMVVDVFGTP